MRVSDVAYEKIKMMIITARLRPGQTLVEASTLDYGRNLSLLKKRSEETGVHVIATNSHP